MAGLYPRAPEVKVFWFFSSEKNALPAAGMRSNTARLHTRPPEQSDGNSVFKS